MSILFFVIYKPHYQDRASVIRAKAAQVMQHIVPAFIHKVSESDFLVKDSGCYYLPDSSFFQQIGDSYFFNVFGDVVPPTDQHCPPNAAFRITNNPDRFVFGSNYVASRTIWYYQDTEFLLVSSSQRAIVTWLGSFKLNQQALSWMLATGNLGPGNSWDTRIKHLQPAQTISLDKQSWKLKLEKRTMSVVQEQSMSEDHALLELKEAFATAFDWCKKEKGYKDTVLTLSGGYDSRTVLYNFLSRGFRVPTVTWGLSSALTEFGTDANAAAAVARELKFENRFFETDFRESSFEPLINQFISYGEGRLDHINSFMDGFRMWNQLYSEGVRRIIRADEVFGWVPANNEQDVRISLDFNLMEDNANMLSLSDLGLESQQFPEYLMREGGESLNGWRDRLYREFRLPYVLTGLHDLIQPYMEVIDPLLHDTFVHYVRRLPDHFRTGKSLYILYAKEVMIDQVPIAIKASIPEPAFILRSARIVSLMLDEMSSQSTRNIFSNKLISWIESNLKVDDSLVNATNNSMATWLKSHTPWQLKKLLRRDLIRYKADFNQVAFRVVLIARMNRKLLEDAEALVVTQPIKE